MAVTVQDNPFLYILQRLFYFIPVCKLLAYGSHDGLLQLRFLQRWGILAVFPAVLQPVDAAPDILLGAVALDPLGAAVHTAALATDQALRQGELARVLATLGLGLALRDLGPTAPSGQFQLHLLENLARDDGRVVVRHIILGYFTAVLFDLLGQEVRGECFLQQHIAGVLFVAQDVLDRGLGPGGFAAWGKNVHLFQFGLELRRGLAGQKAVEDILDRFGSFGVDLWLAIRAAPVADEVLVLERAFPLLEQAAFTHRDVLAQRFALGLGKGRKPGQVDLTAQVAGIQALFLELNDHTQTFQQPDIADAVQCVAGEAAQGLDQDHVDLVLFAGFDHLHKARPRGVLDAADPVVGKNTSHLPFGVVLDQVGIIGHLPLKAALLFLLLGADAAVGGDAQAFAAAAGELRISRDFPNGFLGR